MREPRDPINQLRNAIECLPRTTREAMLHGIRTSPIILGAYTDNRGGICPMLAAHRNGGRTDFLDFARSWDAFGRAKRTRRASRREIRVLEHLLEASLEAPHALDLRSAIAEHQAAVRQRKSLEAGGSRRAVEHVEIAARRLKPGRLMLRFEAERDRATASGAMPP